MLCRKRSLFSLHSTMSLLNPLCTCGWTVWKRSLHSTMSLLNPQRSAGIIILWWTLHSTMSLLNPMQRWILLRCQSDFTFHNVSIKSWKISSPDPPTLWFFPFHNVSIKSFEPYNGGSHRFDFTFHNVSIKSTWKSDCGIFVQHLYIPQCLY